MAFAGQRDDGFYADIQSIFDLDFGFGGPNKPFDSQAGYNVHTIAGVYATTERRQRTSLSKRPGRKGDKASGRFVQVARQGNPLFNEALVLAIQRLDLYPRALMRLGSGAIAALAMVWLVERAFDLRLMAALRLAGVPT